MKILYLSHYFLPHNGGIENVLFNQAKDMIRRGHSVTIITSKLTNDNEIEYLNKIKILRIPVINILEKRFSIPFPIFHPKIFKIVNHEVFKADIVHTHGHVYLTSFISAFFSFKHKKPFIITQHNTFIKFNNPIFNNIQLLADKTIGKYTLTKAIKIITVSHETKKYVKSIINNKVDIIVSYNGVNTKRFKPSYNKSLLRKKLDLTNLFICLTVRRITFKNGIDTLLLAANKLKNNDKIVFLIAGKGHDLIRIQQYINKNQLKNIKLLGYVPDIKLPSYYAASDLFILPSKTGEGFPLAILEAFSSGLPVIATKSGGQVEVIENDKTGYLVNPIDFNAIAKYVNNLSVNKSIMKKMSNHVRKITLKNFSWEKNYNQLVLTYKKI